MDTVKKRRLFLLGACLMLSLILALSALAHGEAREAWIWIAFVAIFGAILLTYVPVKDEKGLKSDGE